MRELVDDFWMGYVAAYTKIGIKNAVGLSFKNFKYDWATASGDFMNGMDYAAGATYARQLGPHFSIGATLKYFRSDRGDFVMGGQAVQPAGLVAGDISAFYTRQNKNEQTGENLTWSLGAIIANIGDDVDYGIPGGGIPLATSAKLGGAISYTATGRHKFSVIADLNKLLVPSPPAAPAIGSGTPKPLINRMLSSFSDAPGGFREEIQEIFLGTGVEYVYADMISVRGGYFGENANKGGRKVWTTGLGVKILKRYTADFSYNFNANRHGSYGDNFKLSLAAYFGGRRG